MTANRRPTFALVLLCVIAFSLRLGAVAWLHAYKHPEPMEHRAIALSIVHGYGFAFTDFDLPQSSSIQSPPYPLLLAGLFRIFGPDSHTAYFAAMVINSIFGALTVAMTYLLARVLGGSRSVGLLAAALVAVWPMQIYSCTVAQAIVLITFSVTAMMSLFYISIRTGKLGPWIAFSLIGTLAALTEPAFLPAMGLSGIIVLLCWRLPMRVRVRNAAVLLLAAAAVIGPWSVRNRRVHGVWVPIKSTFWVNVWKGNNDVATGTDRVNLSDSTDKPKGAMTVLDDQSVRDKKGDGTHAYAILTREQLKLLNGKPEVEREKVFKAMTMTWIHQHPDKYWHLCAVRLKKTLWIDWDNPKSYNLVYIISRAALLLTAAIGLILALGRRWSLAFPALLFFSTLALYTLTITAARFAIPFEPIMLCFSAMAIITIWRKVMGLPSEPLDAVE